MWSLSFLALWALQWTSIDAIASPYERQQIAYVSPFDHSWITEWASVGDSFASGVGLGKRISWWCSRYDNAYGSLIYSDKSLGDPSKRKFNNLACLGHTSVDVLNKQVKGLPSGQQMITLSAGGNDVGFSKLIDACILEFNQKNWKCDETIENTRKAIESGELKKNLDNLIQATVAKLSSSVSSRVFWTSYAKFFDNTTTECDSVTWASWVSKGFNRQEYLTQARRNQYNALVDLLNDKIRDTVKRAGSKVVFVDWQDKISRMNGQYCEPGVDETPGKGDNRESLAFYEWYSNLDEQVFGNSITVRGYTTSIPNPDDTLTVQDAPSDQMGPYQASLIRNISALLEANQNLWESVKQ
ncbi:hypothetical protein VTN77DRAFT_6177 [Rasamsonia byssochlamydoides]|uniref:uncharacterized protein n=1 Tax=Rasamsonia byssochlamydoides TaxID=89139 RepID=UPI003743F975